MMNSLPRWSFIVPSKSFVDVRGAADIVARRIAPTSEDADEPLADAFHEEGIGMSRTNERRPELRETVSDSDMRYAVIARRERTVYWRICQSDFARFASFIETAFA